MNLNTTFDPSLLEAFVGALLTLAGAGAGMGVRRSREGGEGVSESSPGVRHLAALVDKQSEISDKLAGVLASLDALVREDLRRVEERAKQRDRAQRGLSANLDAVGDALDIIVSHIGGQLPEQARISINAKLERRRRDDGSGLH